MRGPTLFLSAGEASGDVHGAALARELRALVPDVELLGMGGPRMAAAGVRLLVDAASLGSVGFAEALKGLRTLKRAQSRLAAALAREAPAGLVTIDFPGFHLGLLEAARRCGVPAVYYIPPAAWAWGAGRADRVARLCRLVLCPFAFEAEFYRGRGARARWVGHPLADEPLPPDPAAVREELGLQGAGPVVALLPGSRLHEVERLFGEMLAAAARIRQAHPRAVFPVPVAHTLSREDLARRVVQGAAGALADAVHLLQVPSLKVLAAADVALVASGTATLEATLAGTPLVVAYRVSGLTAFLAARLVKIPRISLPNILAGREVVPELLQENASGPRLAGEALALLADGERRERMRRDLAEAAAQVGEPGAVRRAAQAAAEAFGLGPEGGSAGGRGPDGEQPG